MVNQLPDVDLRHYIAVKDNQLYTPSTRIADVFGKPHKDVLAKIRKLDCSHFFTERNFSLSEFTDTTGRKLPMFNVTKDGFMFLVMGFTGKQAAAIKEAYINAFNQMAEALQNKQHDNGAVMALQATNQTLQGELLQLYRDKAQLLEQQLSQTKKANTSKPTSNKYFEHKKHQFIHHVVQYLHQNPGANKTNVMASAGYKKDDKTARKWLADYEGIHWESEIIGISHAYFCKE
jgi:Rha family phage regulatory protein